MAVLPTAPRIELSLQKVLVATDFSKHSERATRCALGIARRYGSRLYLLHVVEPSVVNRVGPDAQNRALDLAWRNARYLEGDLLLEGALDGLEDQILIREGQVWECLARAIEEQGIDLVVLGTRGHTGARKLLMGSVADRVFREATVPVFLVGPQMRPVYLQGDMPRRILFPTDLTEASRYALPFAAAMAARSSAQLTILHVLGNLKGEAAADPRRIESSVRASIERMIAEHRLPAPEVLLPTGSPASEILRTATERGSDMIIFGVRRAATLRERLLSPTAYNVVAGAPCPVVTIREGARIPVEG